MNPLSIECDVHFTKHSRGRKELESGAEPPAPMPGRVPRVARLLALAHLLHRLVGDRRGALPPMRSNGQLLDFEEADPDTDTFGLGKIEDFSWKGLLDMGTCTECGRCQSQCPAWVTGKPLSPKQVILDLRDHAFAKAPYLLASQEEREHLPANVLAEAARPLVGTVEEKK